MIQKKMSLQSRRELINCIREKYKQSCWKDKIKILDGFIATTGYERKYAINLLNETQNKISIRRKNKIQSVKYSEEVCKALLTIWYASNKICSKRLVPFLPELIISLERHGHLSLSLDIKQKILTMSTAAVDRLLKGERKVLNRGLSTTRPGSLIKKQIKVRTFADWNNANPGFVEADLVAHCGDRVDGSFLNTLVLTDIASAWTEFLPLMRKSEADVISALKSVKKLFPFSFLGLDTDNGSEFINYKLLKFCEEQKITFTRSRAYHSNDQAHVEEKNGSIVRRIIGYDRYEGHEAWKALSDLYAILRLYINFFQPSMKLISKERYGAKIRKKYDKAQTPYQRLLSSTHIDTEIKENLKKKYDSMDPISLLKKLKDLQSQFFQHAWKASDKKIVPIIEDNIKAVNLESGLENISNNLNFHDLQEISKDRSFLQHYNKTTKPRKSLEPRTWRTRKDPFEVVEDRLKLLVELNPQHTAKSLLMLLIQEDPVQFNLKQVRTLQRRMNKWRQVELCNETGKTSDARIGMAQI